MSGPNLVKFPRALTISITPLEVRTLYGTEQIEEQIFFHISHEPESSRTDRIIAIHVCQKIIQGFSSNG